MHNLCFQTFPDKTTSPSWLSGLTGNKNPKWNRHVQDPPRATWQWIGLGKMNHNGDPQVTFDPQLIQANSHMQNNEKTVEQSHYMQSLLEAKMWTNWTKVVFSIPLGVMAFSSGTNSISEADAGREPQFEASLGHIANSRKSQAHQSRQEQQNGCPCQQIGLLALPIQAWMLTAQGIPETH